MGSDLSIDALSPDQSLLRQVIVRLIAPGERQRWDELMRTHHYLGFAGFVGHSLRYVAESNGRWLALLGWHAAALKCGPRDRWIGWRPFLKYQRLFLIANNSRFLILPDAHHPNLASRVLSINLRRLSSDWQIVYGHELLLTETFVDPQRFLGTCYRAANWLVVGQSSGYSKQQHTYRHHGHPKLVLLYPLHRKARVLLADPQDGPWRTKMNLKALTTKQLCHQLSAPGWLYKYCICITFLRPLINEGFTSTGFVIGGTQENLRLSRLVMATTHRATEGS